MDHRKKLNELLGGLDMTITGAAEFLGISRRTITYWNSGKSEIPDSAIMALNFILKSKLSPSQIREISGLSKLKPGRMKASEHKANPQIHTR